MGKEEKEKKGVNSTKTSKWLFLPLIVFIPYRPFQFRATASLPKP